LIRYGSIPAVSELPVSATSVKRQPHFSLTSASTSAVRQHTVLQ
jgi:hypothetical protein